jgi:hypothetical protein
MDEEKVVSDLRKNGKKKERERKKERVRFDSISTVRRGSQCTTIERAEPALRSGFAEFSEYLS